MSSFDRAAGSSKPWRTLHWEGILVLAGLVFTAPAWAQEPVPCQPERMFQSSGGVRVDVAVERSGVTDADILAALEQAAQQVRERMLAKPPPPPVETQEVPPLPGLAGAGCLAPCPAPPCPEQAHVPGENPDCVGKFCSCQVLPLTLLWQPPLANLREPRTYLLGTSLSNDNTKSTLDTAIGGTVGLWRSWANDHPEFAYQQDFFAVVLTRFSEFNTQVDEDYRFGFPITFAWAGWQAKISYEHTSSHLGDQFMENTGRRHEGLVDDEVVLALAYRFDNALRLYGQYGYGFGFSSLDGRLPNRFDWGIEWSRQHPTGLRGQPFAAFDMELREVQGYQPNSTLEVGWQWLSQAMRPGLRLALTYYNGDSVYGQFFRDRERWVGLGLFMDY
jgi:hypothetical protein